MSLNGSLSDFSVLETLQVIGIQKKTGTLEVESGRRRCQYHFGEGSLVGFRSSYPEDPDPMIESAVGLGLCSTVEGKRIDTLRARGDADSELQKACNLGGELWDEFRDLILQGTLDRVLLWERGHFRFIARSPQEEAGSPWSVEQLLLESMRRLDEAADLNAAGITRHVSPHAGQPFRFVDEPGEAAAVVERALLRRSDGRASLGELADSFALADYDVLTAARSLRDRGLLRLDGRKREQSEQILLQLPRRRGGSLASAGAALALALLGIPALGWGIHSLARNQIAPPLRLACAQREDFDRGFALRTALEMHRLRSGAYPRELSELVQRGLWPRSRAYDFRRYSYRLTDSGYELEPMRG
jgi:hypothetical protein